MGDCRVNEGPISGPNADIQPPTHVGHDAFVSHRQAEHKNRVNVGFLFVLLLCCYLTQYRIHPDQADSQRQNSEHFGVHRAVDAMRQP